MPLHDWSEPGIWEAVNSVWNIDLMRHLNARLPEGYRAFVANAPMVLSSDPDGEPDLSVRRFSSAPLGSSEQAGEADLAPDVEVAVAVLEEPPSLYVRYDGCVVAAIELVSPRNKDRQTSKAIYSARYLGYLMAGVNLLLVDVHPRPARFSFIDTLNGEFGLNQPPAAPPAACAYRVAERAAFGGRMLAVWQRQLAAGAPLPEMPLPLNVRRLVMVDLEATYNRAAEDAGVGLIPPGSAS